MSAATSLVSEDHFLCSICLQIFTDPVTTSCGHNFCQSCITQYWNMVAVCTCPMCNEVFHTQPLLKVNTFISGMVSQFRHEAEQKASSSSSEQQAAKPGEILCDVCAGAKAKALKSCLVCLVSYCQTHLEPHLTASGLKRHQLVEPVENLEGRMCVKHQKPLELFCKREQTCVCMMCSVLEHKNHKLVPLREEYERKKMELGKTEAKLQQMIQKRRVKVEEVREWLKRSQEAADRETAAGVEMFTALKESVERSLEELLERMQEQQRRREEHAEALLKDLEEDICELMKRRSEVEQLCLSEDHLHLLQHFSSLEAAPASKDCQVSVCPPSCEGTVVRALAQLEETLTDQMKKSLTKAELQRVQQYAVEVSLDPDTAHPRLILSDDGKQVYSSYIMKKLPDNPERFSWFSCVLGKQRFSSGRFYFEVQVKGKTFWYLGVAKESVDRKKTIPRTPNGGFWTLRLLNGNEYKSNNDLSVSLSLKSVPEKVGVFVDYEEGLVSFYDVDTAALIYSFTGCCFTEKLYPVFSPCFNDNGTNSAPLIICPVSQTV